MPELLDRLKTALADRYTIEREIGAGGMATVYLAEDLKHKRNVAVKVLPPVQPISSSKCHGLTSSALAGKIPMHGILFLPIRTTSVLFRQ